MKRYSQNHPRSIFAFSTIILIFFAAALTTADPDDLIQSIDRANAFILKHNIAGTKTSCCTVPGDANDDDNFNVADPVFVINYIFRKGTAPPCPNAADVDGDCAISICDVVQMLGSLFKPTWPYPAFECAADGCFYYGY